jgi:hypothetical protein
MPSKQDSQEGSLLPVRVHAVAQALLFGSILNWRHLRRMKSSRSIRVIALAATLCGLPSLFGESSHLPVSKLG